MVIPLFGITGGMLLRRDVITSAAWRMPRQLQTSFVRPFLQIVHKLAACAVKCVAHRQVTLLYQLKLLYTRLSYTSRSALSPHEKKRR